MRINNKETFKIKDSNRKSENTNKGPKRITTNNNHNKQKQEQNLNPKNTSLVAQPLDPPYRARGYRYTYRTYVFQVSQGIGLVPPQICPIAAEGTGWQGVSQLKLPSEGYRAIRGYR